MVRRVPTYEDDSAIVEWVRARARGVSATVIAHEYGVPAAKVANYTDRVRSADIAAAAFWGEDPDEIRKAYW